MGHGSFHLAHSYNEEPGGVRNGTEADVPPRDQLPVGIEPGLEVLPEHVGDLPEATGPDVPVIVRNEYEPRHQREQPGPSSEPIGGAREELGRIPDLADRGADLANPVRPVRPPKNRHRGGQVRPGLSLPTHGVPLPGGGPEL